MTIQELIEGGPWKADGGFVNKTSGLHLYFCGNNQQAIGLADALNALSPLVEALRSIEGQTDDQMVDGVWREVNATAKAALEVIEK